MKGCWLGGKQDYDSRRYWIAEGIPYRDIGQRKRERKCVVEISTASEQRKYSSTDCTDSVKV
jgi:hypothetical protein